MHILDDTTLIQQFISGKTTLAANQNLRIEPAFDSVQLLTKRGGLIASIKRMGSRQTVLMREKSDYSALMHQILLTHHFIATPGVGDQPGFAQYRSDEIPPDYEVTYTTAKELWKEWWRAARHNGLHSIHLDLLIFARDTWYPIRNIVCSQGTLFISTLVSEITLDGNERLTWLRRSTKPSSASPSPLTSPKLARSLQPLSSPVASIPLDPNRPTVSASSNFINKREGLEQKSANSELRQVLRFRQGKLYVKTALGEIVVEGSDLRYRLDEGARANEPQKPLNLNGYRDREGRAINH